MSQSKPLILLIDPDKTVSRIIEFKVRNEGLGFEHRSSGKEGYQAIKKLKPDVVILDIILPTMNGFEILKKVKQNEELKHIKVLMLSATKRMEDYKLMDELEADEYVEKPFIPDGLMIRIRRLLRQVE